MNDTNIVIGFRPAARVTALPWPLLSDGEIALPAEPCSDEQMRHLVTAQAKMKDCTHAACYVEL